MNFRAEDPKDFMVKFLSSFVDLSEADFVTEKVEQVVEDNTDAEFGLQTIMKLNSKMREKLECSELDNSRSGHWLNSILLTFHYQGSV